VTLQRALEDAWRFAHFAEDADAAGDRELADFFRELADSDRDIAARSRALLTARTEGQPPS
jgi:rubrerythrin